MPMRAAEAAAADRHEVGQIELARRDFAGDDGADAREAHAADREIAGLHEVGGALVFAFAVVHGADQGDAAHFAGHIRPAVGDADAIDRGVDRLRWSAVGMAGLRIEGFELARPAVHVKKDARHLAAAQLLGVSGQRLASGPYRAAPAATERRKVRRLKTPSPLICTCMRVCSGHGYLLLFSRSSQNLRGSTPAG